MYADMHCDTLTAIDDPALGDGQINLAKLQRADCFLQCFAVFLDARQGDMAARFASYADKFDKMIASHPSLCKVTTPAEALAARKEGKIAALLTVEEGGVLQGDIDNLRCLYGRGVRMLTLTWNYPNEIGYPNNDASLPVAPDRKLRRVDTRGLTAFGKEVVAAMNASGMLIDVSHLSDGGFWDVLRLSSRPIVASHSNARSVCSVTRNLTDSMLVALAQKGGVAGLNFCYDFLADDGGAVADNALRHIAHIYDVAGEDVLAIGTDFDGIPLVEGWDADKMPSFVGRLGEVLPARVVDKMLWQNFLRVWQNA